MAVIKGTHHLGLCVTGMDRMVSFYEELPGLKKTDDFTMCGKFLDTVQGKTGMDYRIVKFCSPDGTIIELLEDRGHVVEPQKRNCLQAAGLRHFAFEVDDVDGFYKKIVEKGYRVISEPCTSDDGSMRLFFLYDPEQNLIEIMQLYA